MNGKRSKLVLVLATLVLLLTLALGSVAPGVSAMNIEFRHGTLEIRDGMHGLLCPSAGGGSGA